MLTFQDFDRYISIIKREFEFIDSVSNIMRTDILYEKLDCLGLSVELLGHIFHDENGWIDWWIFECGFGQNDIVNSATGSNGTAIALRTTRELYDFLCSNNKEGDTH